MTALDNNNGTMEDGLFETSKFGNFRVNVERIGPATQSIENGLSWKSGFMEKIIMISFGKSRHIFNQPNSFTPASSKRCHKPFSLNVVSKILLPIWINFVRIDSWHYYCSFLFSLVCHINQLFFDSIGWVDINFIVEKEYFFLCVEEAVYIDGWQFRIILEAVNTCALQTKNWRDSRKNLFDINILLNLGWS